MKLIILNEAGYSLRSLPNNKFNSEGRAVGKKLVHWTFSDRGVDLEKGIYSPTIEKALKKLADAGFVNLKVVPLDDEIDDQLEEANYKASVDTGKQQPRTEEEAIELVKKVAPEELEEDGMYAGVNPKCLACTRNCKQSMKVHFEIPCPQYDMKQVA